MSKTAEKPSKVAAATDIKNGEYLTYLHEYKSAPTHWKFNKTKQTRLLSKLYDKKFLPKAEFKIMVSYMEKLTGKARERVSAEAKEILDKTSTLKKEGVKLDSTQRLQRKRAKKITKKLV